MDYVEVGGVIACSRIARRDADQAELGEVAEIFLDGGLAEAQGGCHGGHARPTLPCLTIGIALQHGVQRDANGAHLGRVVVDHAVIDPEGVGTQGADLCHRTFSFGIRSQICYSHVWYTSQHASEPLGPDAG